MAKSKKKGNAKSQPVLSSAAAAAPSEMPWWKAWCSEGLAWGLAFLILLRPWRDGLTFRTDNFYYLWIIALLFALYLARVLIRGQRIRFGRYLMLAAAFPLVALVLSPATVQVDGTYRALLLWAGHIALFMMVADGLRTTLAFRIVLGAFLLTSFIEAFWGLLHYQYVLPALRRILNENPKLLMEYFNTSELTPLLRHRLESNRAFGRFLFPNALAAFLLVGIPYATCSAVTAYQDLKGALRRVAETGPGNETVRLHHAALIGLLAWIVSFVTCMLLYPFFLNHWTGETDWLGRPVLCVIFLGFLPLAMAAVPYGIARKLGARIAGLSVRAGFFPVLAVCQWLSLYLTFSRGGALAIIVAMGAGVLFLFLGWKGHLNRFRVALPVAVVAAMLVTQMASTSWAEPAAPPPIAEPGGAPTPLDVEGRDLTSTDIVNPASFYLRLTYWNVALKMAADYWLTGIGLGNFSTMYPVYQYLGAGDVQAAHNDYLQFLCETGVFGLAAFVVFWAYLLINGARRILGVPDRREQVLLTAMLVGLLAFLIHANVDFPFINPSLAFFEYLVAGLFLARIGLGMPLESNRHAHRVVAAILLVVTAFSVGASMRVFFSDYVMGGRDLLNVGNPRVLGERARAAKFMLQANPASPTPKASDPWIPISIAYSFIPNLDLLQTFGAVRVPVDAAGRSLRAPTPDEAVPPDSLYFITDPAEARAQALKYAEIWTADLRDLDGLYPHNSELALYVVGMDLEMFKAASDPETQMRYVLDALAWAEKAIARNPMQSVAWQYYGLALTHRANIEPTTKALDYYDQMLDAYEKATYRYPTSVQHWKDWGEALFQVGQLIKDRDPQRSAEMLAQSKEYLEKAQHIAKVRSDLGM